MPQQLHESQGLTIVKNDKNHFIVASLHYTADPDKRSEQWKIEAKAGMRPANWEKEYELNYTALFGEKVFPQFSLHKSKIVVPENIEVPRDAPIWGGFDYGPRNPSSFHIYTAFHDCLWSVWELFEPCNNLPLFAAKLKECPYWHRIKWIAADPSMWSKNQLKGDGLVSIHELFWQEGITKFVRGNRDEQAFIAMLNKYWQNLDALEPGFKISTTCANQIREFEAAVYADQSAKVMNMKNLKEDISNYNNHSIDDLKYFLLSRPNVTGAKKIVIPNMARWWRT